METISYPPDLQDEFDQDSLKRIAPEDWMLELLNLNPDYMGWGPGCDAMYEIGGKSWGSSLVYKSWDEFDWKLDDLNECVNFYFQIQREFDDCEKCGGCGTHPDAQWVSSSFYSHTSPFVEKTREEQIATEYMNKSFGYNMSQTNIVEQGNLSYPPKEILDKYNDSFKEFCNFMRDGKGYWRDDLTKEDLDALEAEGRKGRTGSPLFPDAIDKGIMVRARCEKYGIPMECEACEGHGECANPKEIATMSLVIWILHPRKSTSRGVRIDGIKKQDLPKIFAFLREARQRNASRFAKIPSEKDEKIFLIATEAI